jgi:hypothetical protein
MPTDARSYRQQISEVGVCAVSELEYPWFDDWDRKKHREHHAAFCRGPRPSVRVKLARCHFGGQSNLPPLNQRLHRVALI